MPPVADAFQRGWHEAETVHLLDDALSKDLARAGELNAAMKKRIAALVAYATDIGVAGILFTCSAFGEAIDAVARQASMPVLKPNEAMLRSAAGGKTVGLLATFQPSIPSLQQEFVAGRSTGSGRHVGVCLIPKRWTP
jgi:aspartate/glutamate racemase